MTLKIRLLSRKGFIMKKSRVSTYNLCQRRSLSLSLTTISKTSVKESGLILVPTSSHESKDKRVNLSYSKRKTECYLKSKKSKHCICFSLRINYLSKIKSLCKRSMRNRRWVETIPNRCNNRGVKWSRLASWTHKRCLFCKIKWKHSSSWKMKQNSLRKNSCRSE